MANVVKISTTAISMFCATAVWSADYKVMRSLQLPSPAAETWHFIGDFCDIDDWHPNVNACSLKIVEGSLVRVLMTDTGEEIVQKRIAQEAGLSYTYKTKTSYLPIENFTATFSIEPLEGSLIAWSANFSSEDPTMEQVIVDEIEAGLSAIEGTFASR
ncbi:SRPBCC family protein [uncultured Roseobacter sp.]|uniref:SRPBCC family protein n=1 Tax=uncultured Roseobacter sp. TaxID=114847 RepID=UPI002614B070|nr:SRPBCC family protein [uncultured Roseobacter sp.]